MKSRRLLALGIAALIPMMSVSGAAHAQYYSGLNFDALRYSPERVAAVPLPELGFFIANTALDDRRLRYGLRLGYHLSPALAVVTHAATFDKRESALLPTRRYGLDLIGSVPVSERFSLYASAGAARLHGDNTIGGSFDSGLPGSSITRVVNAAKLGVGFQYQFSNSLGLRFDVERYRALGSSQLGAFDVDNVSLGVSFKF
jgi:opacity protein-like surface antigen